MKEITINLTKNAHPHAEMIAAKAADMSLVLFFKSSNEWCKCDIAKFEDIYWNGYINFFLCLPKHEKECLHWLNGGEVQFDSEYGWVNARNKGNHDKWWGSSLFMREDFEFRIKPKKEKRWIGVSANGITTNAFDCKQGVYDSIAFSDKSSWSIHEIEVEVTQ